MVAGTRSGRNGAKQDDSLRIVRPAHSGQGEVGQC